MTGKKRKKGHQINAGPTFFKNWLEKVEILLTFFAHFFVQVVLFAAFSGNPARKLWNPD
jgi:hypothetical protein